MGSKMSFSRGNSGQNTVSELTSVASHPRNSIHAPSDGKQIVEDKKCSDEDLESRWREEMKAAELTQPAPESHSSGHVETDGLINSETAGTANCQHSEHTSSQVGMEAGPQMTPASVCSSTTDSHGQPVEVHKKQGSTHKMIQLLTEDISDPELAGFDAVQHKEISTTIPLPRDGPLINDAPPSEMSGSHSVSDGEVLDGVPMLPKRRKGRPTKKEMADYNAIVNQITDSSPANGSGLARTLRSRGEQHTSAQDGNPESDSKVDPNPTDATPAESGNTVNFQSAKRRRAKLADQQVPAKVSRLDVSQEASLLLSNDTGCGKRAETDKQVELNTDKQESDTNGKRVGQEQQTEVKEDASAQRTLSSQPAAESELLPSVGLNSPTQSDNAEIKQSADMNCREELKSKSSLESPTTNPQSTDPSNTDVTSSKHPPNPAGVLPAMKAENNEMELDHLSLSESKIPKLLQCNANTTVKSDVPNCIFRRKRGGKRRRRINLLQRKQLVEGQKGSDDAQKKPHCDNGESKATTNVDYTKKGGKTVLKCGYCDHTFKFRSQFEIHQRIHTGERPFKCPECGKGFSKNSNLNLHLKTHKKSNIYQKCPFCKIKFSCLEYASHMKMHVHVLDKDSVNNNSEKHSRASDHENSQGLHRPVSQEKRDKKVCQYCGKTFPFQSALIRHVRVHTGEKPYKCDICGKAFGQAYFLRVHELTHWSVKRYNCTRCEKSFTHYSNAKNHNCRPSQRYDDSQPNRCVKPSLTYTCHICKNIFDHLQEFNSHMRAHTGAKLYRCLYCDKLFAVLSEFSAHRSHCRGERNASSSAIKEEQTMALIQYTVPTLRCSSGPISGSPLTGAELETIEKPSQASRKSKKRFANLKKPFQSTVVPTHHLSHLVSKLNKLDNRSDPRKYLCPSCGRQFRHMGRLRAHMLTHAPGQSYTCACCGKTLENWKKLWHHQRVHRQRRGRFTCPQCGQGFRFVEPYRKHMSEHPELQWVQVRPKKVFLPYQCEQCRCSFKTLDLLFNHQLCHSSDMDLSIDYHTTQSNKKLNNHIAALRPDPEEDNSLLTKCPEPQTQESPLDFMYDLGKTTQHPSSTPSIQDRESRTGETALLKPISPLRTVKGQRQNASMSNEASADGVKCAVCGHAYLSISDLYDHYLQHARGQV